MREILPGVHHWTTHHEGIGVPVHSYLLGDAGGGVLIDPRVPEGGIEVVGALASPHDILLTNRHHYRHSDRFREAFGCRIRCHRAGLHEFRDDQAVEGFEHGDPLPNGYLAVRIGALCPEETGFHTVREGGILCLGDAVVRMGDGADLSFVPEEYMGDDPNAVERGLVAALKTALDFEFRHLLLAHGEPILESGKQALERFVERAG